MASDNAPPPPPGFYPILSPPPPPARFYASAPPPPPPGFFPIDDEGPQRPVGVWDAVGEGARLGLHEAGQGLTLRPFTLSPEEKAAQNEPAPPPTPAEVLLRKGALSGGGGDPAWWAGNIAKGAIGSAPVMVGALAGGAGGTLLGGPVGGAVGAAAGGGLAAVATSLAPQFRAGLAKGMSPEDAATFAWQQSGIAGAFGAVAGALPGVSLTGKLIEGPAKRALTETLLQITAAQPAVAVAQHATQSVAAGETPTLDELATTAALGAGTGIAMTGAHVGAGRVVRAVRGEPPAPPPAPIDRPTDPLEVGSRIGVERPGGPISGTVLSIKDGIVTIQGDNGRTHYEPLTDLPISRVEPAPPPQEPGQSIDAGRQERLALSGAVDSAPVDFTPAEMQRAVEMLQQRETAAQSSLTLPKEGAPATQFTIEQLYASAMEARRLAKAAADTRAVGFRPGELSPSQATDEQIARTLAMLNDPKRGLPRGWDPEQLRIETDQHRAENEARQARQPFGSNGLPADVERTRDQIDADFQARRAESEARQARQPFGSNGLPADVERTRDQIDADFQARRAEDEGRRNLIPHEVGMPGDPDSLRNLREAGEPLNVAHRAKPPLGVDGLPVDMSTPEGRAAALARVNQIHQDAELRRALLGEQDRRAKGKKGKKGKDANGWVEPTLTPEEAALREFSEAPNGTLTPAEYKALNAPPLTLAKTKGGTIQSAIRDMGGILTTDPNFNDVFTDRHKTGSVGMRLARNTGLPVDIVIQRLADEGYLGRNRDATYGDLKEAILLNEPSADRLSSNLERDHAIALANERGASELEYGAPKEVYDELAGNLRQLGERVDPKASYADLQVQLDERLANMGAPDLATAQRLQAEADRVFPIDEAHRKIDSELPPETKRILSEDEHAKVFDLGADMAPEAGDRDSATGRVETRPETVEPGADHGGGGGDSPTAGAERPPPGAFPSVESTPIGEQFVLPGGERSAVQAAKAREAAYGGKLAGKTTQEAANEGLFKPEPSAAERALFSDVPDPAPEPRPPGGRPAKLTSGVDPADVAALMREIGALGKGLWSHVNQSAFWKGGIELVNPMSTGAHSAQAAATDFANLGRRITYETMNTVRRLEKDFTPAELKSMWRAMDEASAAAETMRKNGSSTDAARAAQWVPGGVLGALPRAQRHLLERFDHEAQRVWDWLQKVGAVKTDADGILLWTPRIIRALGAEAELGPLAAGPNGARPDGGVRSMEHIGTNASASASSLKHRKYERSQESLEAAMRRDPNAHLIDDIRTLPMALGELQRVAATRELVNRIKEAGDVSGQTLVSTVEPRETGHAFVKIDHPAFTERRLVLRPTPDGEGGMKRRPAHEAIRTPDGIREGKAITESAPLYIRSDFAGPLRAVLSKNPGEVYKGLMSLKHSSMSAIMASPMIHRLVIWGKAAPATALMGRTVGRVVLDGQRTLKDTALVREALDAGVVPAGGRGRAGGAFDYTDMARDLKAGHGISGYLGGKIGDAFDAGASKFGKDPNAGAMVRRGIDKMWDYIHNKLLWDWVHQLQMGLYTNSLERNVEAGHDRATAARMAAHTANRYAGTMTDEAMGHGMRRMLNLTLFSRMFTVGNIALYKDALVGLPGNIRAQIEQVAGKAAADSASSAIRRQAIKTLVLEMGAMYVANSLLQSAVNAGYDIYHGHSVSEAIDNEKERYKRRIQEGNIDWTSFILKPFATAGKMLATSDNEPGKEARLRITSPNFNPANERDYYARVPVGKVGEDLVGWATNPLTVARNKLSPQFGALLDLATGLDSRGIPVRRPDAGLDAVPEMVKYFMSKQVPLDWWKSIYSATTGDSANRKLDTARAVLPFTGLTLSSGYPGGPLAAEGAAARRELTFARSQEFPGFRDMVRKEIARAEKAGTDPDFTRATQYAGEKMGMLPREVGNAIRNIINPHVPKPATLYKDAERLERLGKTEEAARMRNMLRHQAIGGPSASEE